MNKNWSKEHDVELFGREGGIITRSVNKRCYHASVVNINVYGEMDFL